MGGFSSSSFAVVAFSVAAFAFDAQAPQTPETPIVSVVAGGGGGGAAGLAKFYEEQEAAVKAQILQEDEIIVMAVAQMIANGVLG